MENEPYSLEKLDEQVPPAKRVTSAQLHHVLKRVFGFDSFRAHQEKICTSVANGRDTLVVMPTGAGKSLCYQLPGLVLGGTTLVISPLTALIDDQVAKLKSLNIRAAGIHAGKQREDSRQAYGDYVNGVLQFLFIAPERLGIPGFAQLLEKRPPTLIAVDESHCISHWGHDFRPDYRLLGNRLQQLRLAPVLALTATATPQVQDDIVTQLNLRSENRFISGFRRDNIAIQIQELQPKFRTSAIVSLLKRPERLPAIVYAPTRKSSEQLFSDLTSHFKVGVYHAGLPPERRERAQSEFLDGKSDVIIATIAFGMGIDKANVRTVIHSGLPATVEGYYQEIGRAGRDGNPSKAVLMHSYGDKRTHEYFFETDYPEEENLKKIYDLLKDNSLTPKLTLQKRLSSTLNSDQFEASLEKLWLHKGASVDPEERVGRGDKDWITSYSIQRNHRANQLRLMSSFVDSPNCRMIGLIGHFGDRNDLEIKCGHCDVCLPSAAHEFVSKRELTEKENLIVNFIVSTLASRNGQAAGKLFQALSDDLKLNDRTEFEEILKLLTRERLLDVSQESFSKDGKLITYRRVSLSTEGRSIKSHNISALQISGRHPKKPTVKIKKSFSKRAKPSETSVDFPATQLFEKLKAWRLKEARTKNIPAFRIVSDRALAELCEALPQNQNELLKVKGFGPKLTKKYGAELLAILEASIT